jgi:5-methylcytosine-specific restriction endonuclease McrA
VTKPLEKQCQKCREIKSAADFGKATQRRDGLQKQCKACQKAYREENRRRIHAYLADYRSKNQEKAKNTTRAWRDRNLERSRESCRSYAKRNKATLRLKRKDWEANNRELIREAAKKTYNGHKEKRLQKHRLHYLNNKEQYRARDRKRRALELNAPGSHTPEQIAAMFARQKGRCASPLCDRLLHTRGRSKYHIDHTIPLSRGGSNDISNIALLCPTCNRAKGAKTMDEYIATLSKAMRKAA